MVLIYNFAAQLDETINLPTVIASKNGEHAAPRPLQPMEPARLRIEDGDTALDESTNPSLYYSLPPSPLSLASPLRNPQATLSSPPVPISSRSVLNLPRQPSSGTSRRSSLSSTPSFQQSQSSAASSISQSDSTATYQRRASFNQPVVPLSGAFSLNNEASPPANEALAPIDEPSAVMDDRSAATDRDIVNQRKPYYRRWSKMTITVVTVAAFLLAIFSAVIAWWSYKTAQDALKLQADAARIAGKQAALQEWTVYKTFWDSCITFGVSLPSVASVIV